MSRMDIVLSLSDLGLALWAYARSAYSRLHLQTLSFGIYDQTCFHNLDLETRRGFEEVYLQIWCHVSQNGISRWCY